MRKFLIPLTLVLLASFTAAIGDADVLSLGAGFGTRFTCSRPWQSATDMAVVKAIGDVNNDNLADIVVSFPNQDPTSVEGIVAIIYGSAQLQTNIDVCTFTDTSIGFRIRGSSGSKFGANVVDMGDLNGDGVTDIAVGAPGYSTGVANVGRVYVLYLPTLAGRKIEYSVAQIKQYTLTSASITATSGLGTFMADPVDYNGDGMRDVMVGNSASDNNIYVFFGQQGTFTDVTTQNLLPTQGAIYTAQDASGTGTYDTKFGRVPFASCGDLNSDGIADYVVPGAAYLNIIWGMGKNPSTLTMTFPTVASTATTPGLNNYGQTIAWGTNSALVALTPFTSNSVICADMDQDGIKDVVLSAGATAATPTVYILYGQSIKNFAQTTIAGMQQYLGVNIYQVVASSTFGNQIKRGTGWNGYGQDFVAIADSSKSVVYALYSSQMFGATPAPISFIIDNIAVGTGMRVYSSDTSYKVGTSLDVSKDVNYDGINDLIASEGITYNSYVYFGQCNSANGCACPYGYRFRNGFCQGYWLSGGQKTGIIVGVVIGALLLIFLGVLVLKKTACGQKCFESYSKPAAFGAHTHNPIPQTMATSA